jgi:S1-C subfamily serine protease
MASYDDRSYPPRPPRRTPIWPLLLLCILAGMLIWRWWPHQDGGLNPNAVPRAVTARGDLSELEKGVIDIYKQASPSVVHVTSQYESQDYGLDVQQIPTGTGTGFVWDDDGHVVTNNHVVAGAESLEVILADHSRVKAHLVGTEPDSDLAVLQIDVAKGRLHPILVGTSHDLQVGQSAFAIGNPFGLDQTLTTGVVSALDREIKTSEGSRSIKGAIQTDAAINPGNSGGPLLDSAGRLIGVNTAIISPSRAYAGISFAIPVDEVNRVVPELIRNGKIAKPGLGIKVASDQLNRQVSQQLGIDGVLIMDVIPDSPAAKAGLRPTRRTQLGDIILAVDGQAVRTGNELRTALDQHKVGDTVTLTIERDDEKQKVQATLGIVR